MCDCIGVWLYQSSVCVCVCVCVCVSLDGSSPVVAAWYVSALMAPAQWWLHGMCQP